MHGWLSIKRRFPISSGLLCRAVHSGSLCELTGTPAMTRLLQGLLWGSSLGASLQQWRQTGWHRQLGSAGSSWEDQWKGGSFQNASPTLLWFPVQGTMTVGSGWRKELRTWNRKPCVGPWGLPSHTVDLSGHSPAQCLALGHPLPGGSLPGPPSSSPASHVRPGFCGLSVPKPSWCHVDGRSLRGGWRSVWCVIPLVKALFV